MVPVCWLKIHSANSLTFLLRNQMFQILYNQSKERIKYKKRTKGVYFRKSIKENRSQNTSTIKFSNPEKFSHLFCIIWAAWPSGKAGDCKSFFPSSNPGVASSTNKKLRNLFFCSADITRRMITREKQRNVDTLFDSNHKEYSRSDWQGGYQDFTILFYH